jgi:radical SAM protein with 4Fe4S-binding SPASM domain
MLNLTRLWTGCEQPADHLRYGKGECAPKSARGRRPIVVWNITRTCNLRCIHCYSDSAAEAYPGELDWDQMKGVVEDLAAYKVPGLLLSGGEPTVHPRFEELLEMATGLGIKATISTNGTLITKELADRIREMNVAYVGISLDGIGDIHDHFRGKKGAFDLAVRGFRHCHAAGQKTGLRLTLTNHNVENLSAILDFIEAEDIKRSCFYHLVPAGRGSGVEGLNPEMSRQALDILINRVEQWHAAGIHRELLTVAQPADGAYLLLRMQRENHPLFEETRRLLEWNGGGANSSGRGIANIDPQGNVHPDQFWQDVTLGNVKRQAFSEIWEGESEGGDWLEEIRSIGTLDTAGRRALVKGRCAECRFFDECGGGFRTRAAYASDDFWGSDPGCYLTEEEIGRGVAALA